MLGVPRSVVVDVRVMGIRVVDMGCSGEHHRLWRCLHSQLNATLRCSQAAAGVGMKVIDTGDHSYTDRAIRSVVSLFFRVLYLAFSTQHICIAYVRIEGFLVFSDHDWKNESQEVSLMRSLPPPPTTTLLLLPTLPSTPRYHHDDDIISTST